MAEHPVSDRGKRRGREPAPEPAASASPYDMARDFWVAAQQVGEVFGCRVFSAQFDALDPGDPLKQTVIQAVHALMRGGRPL